MQTALQRPVPVRGTQSFVYTLSWCWRRPLLTGLEVSWRWLCGIPLLFLLWHEAERLLSSTSLDTAALSRMSLLDPVAAAGTLGTAVSQLLPSVLGVARWLVPCAAAAWIVVSGLGRTVVLRRADPTLRGRPGTLMLLHAARLLALVVVFGAWIEILRYAGEITVNDPIASGSEPNVVLYASITIVATLACFTAWAVASWAFSAAPLLAMRNNTGPLGSMRAAFGIGPLRSKLVEINLVMGIVKIALIVLAMVLSACPLPFESFATPEFMTKWYAGVAVLYLVASDFFHVVQLVSYLNLRAASTTNAPADRP